MSHPCYWAACAQQQAQSSEHFSAASEFNRERMGGRSGADWDRGFVSVGDSRRQFVRCGRLQRRPRPGLRTAGHLSYLSSVERYDPDANVWKAMGGKWQRHVPYPINMNTPSRVRRRVQFLPLDI